MLSDILNYAQSLGDTDFILIGIVTGFWLFRFLYDILFYGRLSFRRIAPPGATSLPITVFLTERNEEERLSANLPGWLTMGYPSYEMLVVDDFSEDNSLAVLGLLRRNHTRLKLTSLKQETRYSEKLARNLALKAASHDIVVMSHPAAVTPDHHWLPGISASVSAGKDFVVGYCNLLPQKGMMNTLYRVESFYQQIRSMSYCINRMPFVAGEENVAFRKDHYFTGSGLSGKIREEYLNLEMVINEAVTFRKVAVLPAGNLALRKVLVVGSDDIKDLYYRYFRLIARLRPNIRFMLKLPDIASLLLVPGFILLFILYPGLAFVWGVLLLIKSLIYLFIIKRLQNRLQEPKIFVSSLVYSLFAPYYKAWAKWRFNNIRKKRKWGT